MQQSGTYPAAGRATAVALVQRQQTPCPRRVNARVAGGVGGTGGIQSTMQTRDQVDRVGDVLAESEWMDEREES